MDTSIKFCEIGTKSVLQLIILYHMLNSCVFFLNIVFLYSLRIELKVSNVIQIIFNSKDNKFSRLLVILDAKIHGTILKFCANIN